MNPKSQARRTFLATGAALGAAPWLPHAAAAQPEQRLLIASSTQSLVGGANPATAVWAYNGTVPGPALRLKQGERLRVVVDNALDAETTVHWHGIRLPNGMDGVPHLTQPPIAGRGGRFTYEFALPDAGTFWYHPHWQSFEQVGRGLFGALVVEEPDPPAVDRDQLWVLSDWRLDAQARIVEDFGNFMDASHAGRIGNTVTVNGAIREDFAVRSGERIRLRLVNTANARIFALGFSGHKPWVIALDGHPIDPYKSTRVVLGPGMRADLILDCSADPKSRHRVIDDFYPRRAYRLLDLVYSGASALKRGASGVPRLRANSVSQPEVSSAERHLVRFEGGMMGNMPGMGMQRMPGMQARDRMAWTVNGKAMPDTRHDHQPILQLGLGRSYVLQLVNDTQWHHPIHLHGHTFLVLSRDGQPNPRREWSDTVLLDPQSRAEIAFVADNPGNWMLHCHILEHQASGMMAVVRVG
jgi:FtsP/CotA-like multicopper oxidase with cupredoxin domain